jgi:NAD-dependent deacetylase
MSQLVRSLGPGECAELIRSTGSLVVLTGAGLSTAAGIPDFRGPEGLYATRRYNPDLVFSIDHFRRDPLLFYQFTQDFMEQAKDIRPTFTHRALSAFEDCGLVDGIITQNIDALHYQAGSRRVIELHGSYWSASCCSCAKGDVSGVTCSWWNSAMKNSSRSPIVCCHFCGGVIKPDVVFFGEAVKDFEEAAAMVSRCDLLLVLGSSLAVYPAAVLPKMASGTVIVVNQGAVMLPPGRGRYFIDQNLNEYFQAVAEELGVEVP